MHKKNTNESNGYWIDSRSAKKKCGEWLEVSNDNYGCLTYGRFEENKKNGCRANGRLDLQRENNRYLTNGRFDLI